MSRQSPLNAQYEGRDGSRIKTRMPSPSRTGKQERPIERFCSEQQRHEKIALMMSEGRDDRHALRRTPPEYYCSQHDHISETEGFASGPSPHGRPPSPAFQPFLEIDGNDIFPGLEQRDEEYVEEDPHFEAIRIAARVK